MQANRAMDMLSLSTEEPVKNTVKKYKILCIVSTDLELF